MTETIGASNSHYTAKRRMRMCRERKSPSSVNTTYLKEVRYIMFRSRPQVLLFATVAVAAAGSCDRLMGQHSFGEPRQLLSDWELFNPSLSQEGLTVVFRIGARPLGSHAALRFSMISTLPLH